MLYLYSGIGAVFLILVFIITNRYLKREHRFKAKLNYFLQHKNYGNAVEFAKKIISLRPKNPEYHFLLADIYIKSKMIPSAIDIYKKMLNNKIFSIKVKEYNIKEKIALINLDQGKIIEAFKELYVISKMNPTSVVAQGLLGRIYGSQRKYDKAKEYLKKVLDLDPDNDEWHYQFGLAYLDTGDLSHAVQSLDKAYQINPEHVKAQYFLALSCKQKGMNEKAKMLFAKLNIQNLSGLPENITNIGIMTQNIPLFEIDSMEAKLNKEISTMKSSAVSTSIHTIDELLETNMEDFHSKGINIISKMGYIIKEEVKNRLIDNSTEMDFIAISKREKDKSDATRIFIQFTKSRSEIGTIPFADFLSKMHEANINNGVFTITSEFSPQVNERVSQEKVSIVLIDDKKLKRFL